MNFGKRIRSLRTSKGWLLRELAAKLEMDPAILSKLERGLRRASKAQMEQCLLIFKDQKKELKVIWLSDRIMYELKDEEYIIEALQVAEQEIQYNQTHHEKNKTSHQTKSRKL